MIRGNLIPSWFACCAILLAMTACVGSGAEPAGRGRIELVRDTAGVPHIFADTDAGTMCGLGYATAEDRAFQMTYSLRIIQGRLSEVVGVVRRMGRDETSLDNDKKMRTFGFRQAAQRVADNLDSETRSLLQAYCDGVNAYFAENRDDLHPLFDKYDVAVETWVPADCLLSWWHLAQFFASDGTRDLNARRNLGREGRDRRGSGRGRASGSDAERRTPEGLKVLPPDDEPAIVKREDLKEAWIERVFQFAREHGMMAGTGGGETAPKFSHAWVVGGQRTTTGSSVLVSDPQTPVRNPSLFYEYHLRGETFDVRGVGVPGSPLILIGFSDHVAWGATALGADQADLFLLQTDPERPDQYFFDGQWRPMDVRRETIRVRGGDAVEYEVRETHLGPVASPFCFVRSGEEVALKRIPTAEADRETIQAAVEMWRAKNARQFLAALPRWRFPSCNMVWGDREGAIGYQALAAIPIRSRHALAAGRAAHDGVESKYDWQGIVPYDLLPHVINPKRGYVASGNHRAIESWYPIPLGVITGGGGDTVRSWRLRERLDAKAKHAPEDVLDIHYDSVNPARRDIVRLGIHLRDVLQRELSDDAARALDCLDDWYRAGASSDLSNVGAEMAVELNTFFRFVYTDLAVVYGGGESGLSYFLKTATARLDDDPTAPLDEQSQDFIERSLADAWRQVQSKYGRDSSRWNTAAREQVRQRNLGYYVSLDGFPSLNPAHDLKFPAITTVDGGTIKSQASQCYTQWAPMHDPDSARTVLPIGLSERPDSTWRTSNMEPWERGKLHPAPLSRRAVTLIAASRKVLAEG